MAKITVTPKFTSELDPEFTPGALYLREFAKLATEPFALAVKRPNGAVSVRRMKLLAGRDADSQAANLLVAERTLKFMLWMYGGCEVLVAGNREIGNELGKIYAPTGARAFDYAMMGRRIYKRDFTIQNISIEECPEEKTPEVPLGNHLDGCRVGFDLGGSDRKCAAVIDGKCVFSEEVKWDPYFQSDPEYHKAGIRDSIQRAAAHLPRIDGIGGSSAGVYVDGQPRLVSLFRGVSESDFQKKIWPLFDELAAEFKVPFVVANDGEVTALAGSMSMHSDSVLGVSMGTSVAAGFVNARGNITDYLDELAFVPIDFRAGAPADEWSGDTGCAVQYLSQQAVARLAPAAGFDFPADMPFPTRLEKVQEAMKNGDARAEKIFRTIGIYLGYAAAQFADFYGLVKKLLLLGRVSSGKGGDLVIEMARKVVAAEFPEIAARLEFKVPDEEFKRHGQAMIAASLPELGK